MKHEILAISTKISHHRALKDISEALEQKLSSSKDISEAHRVFYQILNKEASPKRCVTSRMIVVK